MALVTGVSEGDGGDFVPYIKYDARAGRWYNRVEGQDDLDEITNPVAIWDLATAEGGWIAYLEGMGPDYQMDMNGQPSPRPSDKHKRGFKLRMFSDKNLGGLREFSSTAKTVVTAVNTIFEAYAAAPEKAAGKLPVVACTGVLKKTVGRADVYEPQLSIVDWADRPEAFGAETGPVAPTPAPAAPEASGSVPPPPAASVEPAAVVPAQDLNKPAW